MRHLRASLPKLYLPIETKNRELDARLLFSAFAAQDGWSVVLGGKEELYPRLRGAEPGIVIEKSIQLGVVQRIRRFKEAGHRVCAWCEEGLHFFTPEDYCHRKVGRESLQEIEQLFAWGNEQANAVRRVYPTLGSRIVVTGNSRMDLTKGGLRGLYDQEVARIREKYGRFYLLNTKFSRSNYIKRGWTFVEAHIQKGYAPTDEQVRLLTKCVRQEESVLASLVEFIARFADELPSKRLVIRPHPAEDFTLWERVARGKSNVDVVHQGNVLAWLLASDLSISNNCTTAVEAFLLGKPGVNFRPYRDEEVEYALPRVVAHQAYSSDELVEMLRVDDPASRLDLPETEAREAVAAFVHNLGDEFAAPAILKNLRALYDLPAVLERPTRAARMAVSGSLARLHVGIRAMTDRNVRARRRLRSQKFPGLILEEVSARLDILCELLDLHPVTVTQRQPQLFSVERAPS